MSDEAKKEVEGTVVPTTEQTTAPAVEAKKEETKEDSSIETKEVEAPVTSPEEDVDFDWDAFEHGRSNLPSDEADKLEKMYADTLTSSVEHEVVDGKVVSITDREAIIDIGSKSEGVISMNEFRYNPDLKEGDDVEVLVDKQEDKNGQLVFLIRQEQQRIWMVIKPKKKLVFSIML